MADGAARRTCGDADLARHATAALIEEAELTPKPALVDGRGSGAHRDLDLPTMRRSARALEATFAALARAARYRIPSATLRAELAQIGRAGEQAMLHATDGSNAHRGAIWIVGLLVAGAAMASVAARSDGGSAGRGAASGSGTGGGVAATAASISVGERAGAAAAVSLAGPAHSVADASEASVAHAARICSLGAQIACFPDRFAPPADTHGEAVRRRYQVGGARREAQDGFPHVVGIGLPALRHARAQGAGENAARVDALLAIMASLDDTCLLHRAGRTGLQAAQRGAQRVLAAGGSATPAGAAALNVLERALIALNASPGGAADLLAATLFLDKLSRQDFIGSTASWNI
ncbi:MAG TPA: triphosphoribosyl-dephospho-CoA synthase [Paraburkholderia sp.]|nr:triphosphoribosyl-dephospho-CoA synthase [Paraburkholderia sp.]